MSAIIAQPPAAQTSQLVLGLMDHVAVNTAKGVVAQCEHVAGGACVNCIFVVIRRVIAASNDIPIPE